MAAMQVKRLEVPTAADYLRIIREEGKVILSAAERRGHIMAEAEKLAKSVDGVYTADPREDPEAVLIRDITYLDAIRRGLKVMDMAAFIMCAEQGLPHFVLPDRTGELNGDHVAVNACYCSCIFPHLCFPRK